jgi:hypothetical protein
LKEAPVAERKTYLAIALLLTIVDAVVVLRYGGAIWIGWPRVVWIPAYTGVPGEPDA